MEKLKLVIITGPTASGKTSLATTLAKQLNGVILTADSRQVYIDMDISTSKVSGVASSGLNPRGGSTPLSSHPRIAVDGVDHFLVNLVAPDQPFTLKDYTDAFWALMRDLDNDPSMSTKPRFLVGGTGLYISSLIHAWGLEHQQTDSNIREKLIHTLKTQGLEALVSDLTTRSPESSSRVDLKNPRRVIRALEHVILTNTPWNPQSNNDAPFDYLLLGVQIETEKLNERIDQRVDEMMKQGLLSEVQKLAKKYDSSLPAMSGIGYKELGEYLRGEVTLDQAIQNIKTATHQYAKRQRTWWRKEPTIQWVENASDAELRVQQFFTSGLSAE